MRSRVTVSVEMAGEMVPGWEVGMARVASREGGGEGERY